MDIIEPEKQREFETILPLVNIVFLLLIFFMLAGAFIKPDMFDITVPNASIENEADSDALIILMNAKGEFAIETTPYTQNELLSLIKEQLEKTGNDITVQLKADEAIKSQDLISIMEALGNTGLDSIHLLTVISKDSE